MTAPLAVRPGPLTRLRSLARGPAVLMVAAAVAGFAAVGQLERARPETPPLEAESEGDLSRILADLNAEADALQNEIADLKVQLNELRRSSENEASAAAAAEEQLRSLQVLAGTVPVTGPGVIVVIQDPNELVTYDTMIDMVQELRDAGAEAIAVNDQRIGAATAFAERDRRITIDGIAIRTPFRISAIGHPATLDGGLKIPGGAVDAVSAVKGVQVEVTRQAKVDLPALAKPPRFDSAKPVAPGS